MKPEQMPLDAPVTEQALTKKPIDLLSIALQHNAAIDVIERLAALQEKSLARDAEIEFNEAMNRVQTEIKRVHADLDNKQTSSKYASYAAMDKMLRPLYSKEGFSLSYTTEDCAKAEMVRVVCFLSLGAHTRKYQIDMPADGKGAKGGDVMTKTHATGAAMSYGMRYLLKSIFNVAIGEEDDDGNTNGELAERIEWLENASSLDELKKLFSQAYSMFETNPPALKALVEAKNKKRKEFE